MSNTVPCSLVPVQVSSLSDVVAIAAGWEHSLAVKSDGTVWTWGLNDSGQLGRTTTTTCTWGSNTHACSQTATQIGSFSDVIAVAGGGTHSLAVKKNGTAWSWGENESGQLGATSSGTCGSPSTYACNLTPLTVGSLTDLAAVAAGGSFGLGLKNDGTVWAWGENDDGELGGGTTDSNVHTTPSQVGTVTGINTIAAGSQHGHASTGLVAQPAPVGTEHNPPYIHQGVSRLGVNTLTGSFSTSALAAGASAGLGPDPVLTYTYNSNDPRVSPLGPGWTHNYAAHIASAGSGQGAAVLVGPQGRSDRYVPSGVASGVVSFTPPDGVSTELQRNADGTYTATFLDQTTWEFDTIGRLTDVTDRYGNQSSLTYDSTTGRLTSVSDPAGRGSLSFSYDSTSGRLTSVSDWMTPSARTVQFAYTTSTGPKRLSTVTDRAGGVTTYCYQSEACDGGSGGSSHRIARITDANNKELLRQTFDSQGRVATQKDGKGILSGGQQTSFSYPSSQDGTTPTVVTEPTTSKESSWNSKLEDTYTADRGFLSKRVDKPSSTESPTTDITYDSRGFLSSIEDPKDHASTLCFDIGYNGQAISGSRGNLTRVISHAPASGVAPLVTLHQYDTHDNLTQTVPPRGVANGTTVTCSTDLSGSVDTAYATDFEYDTSSSSKLEKVTRRFTDPDDGAKTAITKYEYDSTYSGLVSKVIAPRGNNGSNPDYEYATEFTYFGSTSGCKKGLLETVKTPKRDGQSAKDTTTYDYDCGARRTKMTDPLVHDSDYTYDAEGRLLTSVTPGVTIQGESGTHRLTTTYRYDAAGNQTVRISPSNTSSGQVTKFTYDERELLLQVREFPGTWTDPDASDPTGTEITEYTYDHLGYRARVTRAKGVTGQESAVDYAYDGLGRVRTETQYPSWPTTTPTLVTAFTYELNGNRATLTDPLNQVTTFSYDNVDRLTGIAYTNRDTSETTATTNVSFAYDRHSNRTSMTDATGTTSYVLDELDRLTSVSWPGSPTKTVDYRYDLDCNRRKVVYPDSTAVTYAFDKGGRMSSLTDWGSRTVGYEYHADSRLKKVTNWTSNGTTTDYTYDDARRLTEILHKQGSTTLAKHGFGLDRQGDRTRFDEDLPTASSGFGFGATGPDVLAGSAARSAESSELVAAALEPAALPDDIEGSVTMAQAAQPQTPRTELPFTDDQSNPGRGSLFRAEPAKGAYRLELFEKAKPAASVRLEHVFSGALLRFELPGTAAERKAQGAKASARVGDATVEWTAFADGLKENIVLDTRPNQDEVRFNVEMQRLSPVADGKGGYVLYDSYSHPRFHVLAPTVHDAAGKQGHVDRKSV